MKINCTRNFNKYSVLKGIECYDQALKKCGTLEEIYLHCCKHLIYWEALGHDSETNGFALGLQLCFKDSPLFKLIAKEVNNPYK